MGEKKKKWNLTVGKFLDCNLIESPHDESHIQLVFTPVQNTGH